MTASVTGGDWMASLAPVCAVPNVGRWRGAATVNDQFFAARVANLNERRGSPVDGDFAGAEGTVSHAGTGTPKEARNAVPPPLCAGGREA